MTDEQFNKMYEVELAKLGTMQGIVRVLQNIATKYGANHTPHDWKEVETAVAMAKTTHAKAIQPNP